MILKEYQKRTLEVVREYLERLAEWREKSEKAADIDPDFGFDWAERTWQKLPSTGQYVQRRNGLGEPLPTFCLKIPTGGGKTLLATKVIDLVHTHFRRRQSGLVLWIVPTTQIYNQTLRALKDRDHPYRQQLDVLSAGRTLVLEKTSGFAPRDVAEKLCVLLLMLPSANRRTKEQLRMFRDSGGFDRFFPPDDDAEGHRKLLEKRPNLDTFEKQGGVWERQVKTSLGNTLRLLRPLIVLDEGHKAYSRNAKNTLEGFNPYMIVELSATPPKGANVLVNISGRELAAEEMVKLDLHIKNSASVNWQDTLLASVEHRKLLEKEALLHEADTGEHIRPICLIQVERTGREQRKAGFVHAEDVREYLLRHPEVRPEHVAVKTSQKDDLKVVDEVGGLLARDCPVRFIITKQALQEGWDCSFAYVLAILTNPASRSALTQLVGRILRQPYAKKTGVSWLDESYVFCFQRRGTELLQEVRKGFGLEGLQGLESKIVADDDGPVVPSEPVFARQRERYRNVVRDLVLPAFMIKDGTDWRPVRYETDILSRIPWDDVDVSPLFDLALSTEGDGDFELRAGLDEALIGSSLRADADTTGEGAAPGGSQNGDVIDYYFAAGHLRDAIPNPWRGSEAAEAVFGALLDRYPRRQVAANYMFVLEELGKRLEAERDRLSRDVFFDMLASGVMRFLVVTDDLEFNHPPSKVEIGSGKQANRTDGSQFMLNLHERTGEDEMNALETKVATYLDQQARLFFWYRNRSRKDYYVQGWKPRRVYADFVFAMKAEALGVGAEGSREEGESESFGDVFVLETKGLHLKQAEDTEYKRSVFNTCSELASQREWAEFAPTMRDRVVRFEVVDEDEWQQRLNAMLA